MRKVLNRTHKKEKFKLISLIQEDTENGKTIKHSCAEHGISTSTYYRYLDIYLQERRIQLTEEIFKQNLKRDIIGERKEDQDEKLVIELNEAKTSLLESFNLAITEGRSQEFEDHKEILNLLNLEKQLFDEYDKGNLPKSLIEIEFYFIKDFKGPFYLANLDRICEFNYTVEEWFWKIKPPYDQWNIKEMYDALISFHHNLLENNLINARIEIRRLIHLLSDFSNYDIDEPHKYFHLLYRAQLDKTIENLYEVFYRKRLSNKIY